MTKGSKTLSQRAGRTISSLIGIATELKQRTRHEMKEAHVKTPTQFTYEERYKLAIKQRDEAQQKAQEAEARVLAMRRTKLANFSIDDIADELQRRVDMQLK